MKLSSSIQIHAGEGIPEEQGRGPGKYIEKVGTQFCIRGNGVDFNFGCWPDKAKAESVMRGESFITPDVPKNLLAGKVTRLSPAEFKKAERKAGIKPYVKAGGPGSGRKKEAMKEFQRIYKLAKQAGHDPDSAKQVATEAYIDKFKSIRAEGPPMIKFKNPSPYKKSEMGGPKPANIKPVKLKQHKLPNQKLLQANDWGEPNAGAYQHAHLDSNLFFRPPSLEKRGKGDHVPTDDVNETNDRFLDVTKRREAHKQRMDLLKKSSPGGNPPSVPVRTTLVSPTLNSYLPMMASASKRKRHGGGMFRAYGAAKI